MLRRLCIGLLASAVAIAPLTVKAQDKTETFDNAKRVNLKDAVKFNWGIQGALQDAGVTNRIGMGFFLSVLYQAQSNVVPRQQV